MLEICQLGKLIVIYIFFGKRFNIFILKKDIILANKKMIESLEK